jgi:3'(2'), 5'-bisphosphate nucleotidase
MQDISPESVVAVALKAAEAIMQIRNDQQWQVSYKADDSPVTHADHAAHRIIVEGLEQLGLGIPVLSEEGEQSAYEIRRHWEHFWLIDPLDGTKEFIAGTNEFAVNIALVSDRFPVLGVICMPALQTVYWGNHLGAFKRLPDGRQVALQVADDLDVSALRMLMSKRRNRPQDELNLVQLCRPKHTQSVGSALKYCLLAESSADIYYRSSPNMEWDSAAGQAIIEAAGGHVLTPDGQRFAYNKPSLINGTFCCIAAKNIPALPLLSL